MSNPEKLAFKPARSIREFRELVDDKGVQIIRTKRDWQAYLRSDDNVLKEVPREVVADFTKSLVINNGVGAFNYGRLQDTLTFSQFRRLLWRFGIDVGVFADYDGYYCAGKGTCSKQLNSICIGENC